VRGGGCAPDGLVERRLAANSLDAGQCVYGGVRQGDEIEGG